jgi:hypothetical protein
MVWECSPSKQFNQDGLMEEVDDGVRGSAKVFVVHLRHRQPRRPCPRRHPVQIPIDAAPDSRDAPPRHRLPEPPTAPGAAPQTTPNGRPLGGSPAPGGTPRRSRLGTQLPKPFLDGARRSSCPALLPWWPCPVSTPDAVLPCA